MKFEVHKEEKHKDAVAYLHSDGMLMFRAKRVDNRGLEQGVISIDDGVATPNGTAKLESVIENDSNKGVVFYPGDKVTITF